MAIMREVARHFDQLWPLSLPRLVLVEVSKEIGRVHLIAFKASLAEHERHVAEQTADGIGRQLAQRAEQLIVPGSFRSTIMASP